MTTTTPRQRIYAALAQLKADGEDWDWQNVEDLVSAVCEHFGIQQITGGECPHCGALLDACGGECDR